MYYNLLVDDYFKLHRGYKTTTSINTNKYKFYIKSNIGYKTKTYIYSCNFRNKFLCFYNYSINRYFALLFPIIEHNNSNIEKCDICRGGLWQRKKIMN